MRKITFCKCIALFTVVSMFLTGCGSSGSTETGNTNEQKAETVKTVKLDPNDPVEITLWHYYNGVQQQEFDSLVDEFNNTTGAKEGIIVEAYSQGSTQDISDKLKDSVEGKVGADECPDIFSAYSDTAYDYAQQGKLVDLKDYFSEDELSEYVDSYLKSGEFNNDELILFPVAKSTEVFELNKTDWDIFAKETGAKEEDLSTWEGIAKVAKEYYDWSGGKAFFGRDAMANYMFVGSAQLGQEIYTVDEEGNAQYHLDKTIFRKLWDNYYIPYVNGYYLSEGKFRSDDAKMGSIIGCVASSSSAYYFPSEITKEDGSSYPIEVKVLPTPNFEGTSSMAIQQGAGMAVMKSDDKKEYASAEFLKWFTEKEQNTDFSQTSGYLPVKKDAQKSDNLSKSDMDKITKMTIEVTLDMSESYEYYTTQTFAGAYDIRTTLENSLQDKAVEDRAAVVTSEKDGISHDEAVMPYDTDENFESWFQTLEASIKKSE